MEFASITSFRRLFKYITGENEEGMESVGPDVRNLACKTFMVTSLQRS